MPEATLLVIQGPDQGSRIDLGVAPLSVGRGVHNDARILDTEMSRQHAVFSYEEDSWRIVDKNSSNGTFVNGKLVESSILQQGDQIQLGRTILLFSSEHKEELEAASARINLVPDHAADDRSRIVGQARSEGVGIAGHWGQAGANLQLLYQITEEVVRPTASRDELLRRILDLTLESVGADRGCMLVTDSKTDRIEPSVVSHRPGVNVDERMPISTTVVEYVIQNGQGVRTSDAQHDSRFDGGQSILKAGIREVMCAPMHGRYELMGVIYVDTTNSPLQFEDPQRGQFNDQLLRLLLAIGRQSALAIENFRYQDSMITAERLAAVGQTVAIMSHHIKNILQGVRGGGYLVDMGLKDENKELIQKGWTIVERNQERIYNLVMDMLTFSKERDPKLEMTSIKSVVEDVAELMQQRLADRGVQLKIDIDDGIPESMIDPEGFHRAILNLIINAVDALEDQPQPRISISCRFSPSEELYYLDITDNGTGIDPVDLPKLFSLFESSKGSAGTGLGLSVSRKVLQEHGGEITVESELGRGTRFQLQWPYILDDAGDNSPEAEEGEQP
ncbi:ATP-binding protein [Thalassoglobus polymorphus]|uniref:histidine kinase n=1 Tax=Thalassoglobus polymorphus TaxID=2527994 RepID=A0A517QU09_9PLAN|nr:ATP-binding protein [Thalassoglobus polymorphus]QDT35121.1 Sensor protein ZraS [Thalassoglobus polymorphus]